MHALHVVGVRHHSPACARLVAATIRRVRPRFVLIEGPSDMSERVGELLMGHSLPLAVYSFEHGVSGSWSPFCEYSPEWQALMVAREVGATPRFMDLPAWHKAFLGVENRYADYARRHDAVVTALCRELHMDGFDALWDHLFEGEATPAELEPRLATFFDGLRGDTTPSERDAAREQFMRATIAVALAQGSVVAVCGGYHAPALRSVAAARGDWPAVPAPAGAGSFLVPWSYHRLDALTGYASGMPSPGFYDAVFEHGAARAFEHGLRIITSELRGARLHVSAADLIAAAALAGGLARMRGHDVPRRIDLLDGLASALVKDALDVPLPWGTRAAIAAGTDPLVVAFLKALSGTRRGRLHPRTPSPPLVADVAAALARTDLEPGERARSVTLILADAAALAKSRVLHRLRVLAIPGFARQRGPRWATEGPTTEAWTVAQHEHAPTALIEAARYGATLEAAAATRIAEQVNDAALTLSQLTEALSDVVFVGIDALTQQTLTSIAARVGSESDFTMLGATLTRLLALYGGDVVFGARHHASLVSILGSAFERACWLLEHVAVADGTVEAIVALRDVARREAALKNDGATLVAGVALRRAADDVAPAAVRGACLGLLWSLGCLPAEDGAARAIAILRRAATPTLVGDFLGGLFALAREETTRADDVLGIVDEVLRHMTEHDFLVAVPALRLAFGWFPPREKQAIARRIAGLHGRDAADGARLLVLDDDPAVIAAGIALDAAVEARLVRYGLAAAEVA